MQLAVQNSGEKVRVSLNEAYRIKELERQSDATQRDTLGRVISPASSNSNSNSDLLELFKTKKKDKEYQKGLSEFLATKFGLDSVLVFNSLKEFEEKS